MHAAWKRRAVLRSLREYENNWGERWNGKTAGIEGEFGEDYILKGMPSDERRYENLETRERNNKNWKKRSKETDKEKIGN